MQPWLWRGGLSNEMNVFSALDALLGEMGVGAIERAYQFGDSVIGFFQPDLRAVIEAKA